jgi:hypothetical protein
MKLITRCALLCTLVAAVSCEDSTGIPDYGNISASVDGAGFSSNLVTQAKFLDNVLTMIAAEGENPQRQINIILKQITGVGDHTTGPTGTALISYTETSNGTTLGWTSKLEGATGTVTITESSLTGFRGSFNNVVLVPSLGDATGNKTLANGTFDVKVQNCRNFCS